MANYIDRELLCEAYTHLDIETHNDANARERLEAELKDFILPRARFIFNEDVEVRFEFDEGSLKTKIAIIGSAAVLISNYGSFRQGADQLARDAVVLAQAANLEVIFKTRTQLCDRIRIEKRSGVFGRITELLRRAEELRDAVGQHRFPTTERDLLVVSQNIEAVGTWYNDVDKLMHKLESEETKACVAAGLLEELERFPEALPWTEEAKSDSFRARMLKEDVDLAARVDSLAARYARFLALSKEQLKRTLAAVAPRTV